MFCTFLTRIGTEKFTNEEITKALNLCSYDFNATFDSFSDPNNVEDTQSIVTISISALDSKVEEALLLLGEILTGNYKIYLI